MSYWLAGKVLQSSSLLAVSERVSRVLLMLANEQREVTAMSEGNIAVLVGLKHVSLCTLHGSVIDHFPYL